MIYFYNVIIYFYSFAIKLASLFNRKARLWLDGRKNIFERIESELKDEQQSLIWFHASSLGEFEQGRPLIEGIKKKYTNYKIFLTFFSPSGYEVRKNYELADYVFYLPADSKKNAHKFVKLLNPKLAIFIKYEYWFNYIQALKNNNIPIVFVSAIFRENQYFFRFYGSWALRMLRNVDVFFVQNASSEKLLKDKRFSSVLISGDTRFDRVLNICSHPSDFPHVAKFVDGNKVIIGGSTWPQDDKLLVQYINSVEKKVKFIIVPHVIDLAYIKNLIASIRAKCCKFSELNENTGDFDVLIVDKIGYLSHLYRYADISYIGGGFGSGIHNILEAACFGLPVIFGPNYKKFSEAVNLREKGGAFVIRNLSELSQIFDKLMNDKKNLSDTSEICKKYVNDNSGATDLILNKIATDFLDTND